MNEQKQMNGYVMNGVDQAENIDIAIDIKEYFYLFWSWAWLIMLIGLLAGASTYFLSKRATPIYQTTTRLLVSDPPVMRSLDYTTIVSSQTMTNTYAEMLVERPVLQGVIDQLALTITPEELEESISVQMVRDTQLLVVTVEDPNPFLAVDIANSIAMVFTQRISQLQAQRYASTLEGLAKQVSDMEQQIEATSKAIAVETNPEQQLQLEARLTEYRRLYSDLVTNFEQVRLSEAQTSTNVVVSEPASLPSHPVRPKVTRNTLLAVVAGMLVAAGLVFAIDVLDDSIKNPEDIRQKFKLPILGMIHWHEMTDEKPVCKTQPRSPAAEAFRSLRTNITYSGVDTPLRRILITSPTPQDGKTTISANLAVVLAQSGKNVVVVDADLRRPQIHQKFGLLNRIGLSDLFLVVRPLNGLPRGAIQDSGIPGVAVVPTGKLPPNPVELLASKKMADFLNLLDDEYDIVLIDTPPVLSVTDAAALAPGMDGVLLVVRPGKTKLRDFQQTIEQLQAVGAHILGVVLNELRSSSRKYGYYYARYYSKYSHYYK